MTRNLRAKLVIVILACSVGLACQTTRSYFVSNDTMEPTIRKGESVTIEFDAYGKESPRRGEIVAAQTADALVVKRVIAVAGDTVEGKGLDVFLNGKRLDEKYVIHKGRHPGLLDNFGPIKVGAGMLFLMGDNRDFSFDSRSPNFGCIPVDKIRGKILSISQSRDPSRVGKKLE